MIRPRRGLPSHTAGQPIKDAVIDVWQANDEGFYECSSIGSNQTSTFAAFSGLGADGRYWFRAVKPKYYPIPDDGPVGKLLSALARYPYRPAHLHYIIKADGFETLTTHIFDPDDPYIQSDAVFDVKESLLANFQHIEDPVRADELGFSGKFLKIEHNFLFQAKSLAAQTSSPKLRCHLSSPRRYRQPPLALRMSKLLQSCLL
ncbi:hypothetical protein HFN01_01030 [Rhizobium leguminosarum]|uniref:dioxygenase family protein n=1 Tax=Rhizobium leguminosarum TaxID=384 RepID=UPI001C968F3B|nr:hypothetical protein [Rhizobium leguminosarum]MBY5393402.1 hypothetical protein [Rhizobium leguminosarum]